MASPSGCPGVRLSPEVRGGAPSRGISGRAGASRRDTTRRAGTYTAHTIITQHPAHTIITQHSAHTIITQHPAHTIITQHPAHTIITHHVEIRLAARVHTQSWPYRVMAMWSYGLDSYGLGSFDPHRCGLCSYGPV